MLQKNQKTDLTFSSSDKHRADSNKQMLVISKATKAVNIGSLKKKKHLQDFLWKFPIMSCSKNASGFKGTIFCHIKQFESEVTLKQFYRQVIFASVNESSVDCLTVVKTFLDFPSPSKAVLKNCSSFIHIPLWTRSDADLSGIHFGLMLKKQNSSFYQQ